jgi:uncharacterized alpha/beta hydrolase family protein
MMLIALINLVIILVLLLGFVLFLNRREKQRKQNEMERLLKELEENATTRQKQIVNILTTQLGVSESSAYELVDDLTATEKKLVHRFLEIQMNQQPATNFYQYSCECIDDCLKLVAEKIPKAQASTSDAPADGARVKNQPADASASEKEIIDLADAEKIEPETITLDVNETKAISENKTLDDGDGKPNMDVDQEAVEDEFGEEPDWGDAFAEAGVEMDDSLLEDETDIKS